MSGQEPALEYMDEVIKTRRYIISINKEDVASSQEQQDRETSDEYLDEDRKRSLAIAHRAAVINLQLSERYLAELEAKRRLVEKCLRAGHLSLTVQL